MDQPTPISPSQMQTKVTYPAPDAPQPPPQPQAQAGQPATQTPPKTPKTKEQGILSAAIAISVFLIGFGPTFLSFTEAILILSKDAESIMSSKFNFFLAVYVVMLVVNLIVLVLLTAVIDLVLFPPSISSDTSSNLSVLGASILEILIASVLALYLKFSGIFKRAKLY